LPGSCQVLARLGKAYFCSLGRVTWQAGKLAREDTNVKVRTGVTACDAGERMQPASTSLAVPPCQLASLPGYPSTPGKTGVFNLARTWQEPGKTHLFARLPPIQKADRLAIAGPWCSAGGEASDHDRDGRPARDLRRPGRRRPGRGPLLPMTAQDLAGDQVEADLLAGDQVEAELPSRLGPAAELLAGDQVEAELLGGDQVEADQLGDG